MGKHLKKKTKKPKKKERPKSPFRKNEKKKKKKKKVQIDWELTKWSICYITKLVGETN